MLASTFVAKRLVLWWKKDSSWWQFRADDDSFFRESARVEFHGVFGGLRVKKRPEDPSAFVELIDVEVEYHAAGTIIRPRSRSHEN